MTQQLKPTATAVSPHPKHFYELELELQDGDEKRLHRLARRMEKKLHLPPSRLSKFERGLQAAGHRPTISLPQEPHPGISLGTNSPVAQIAEIFFRGQFTKMQASESMAFVGVDPEGVHQMRVASRRLRVGGEVFRDCLLAQRRKNLLTELKWITKMLGEVRDLDVFRDAVIKDATAAQVALPKFHAHLTKSWAAARRELVKSLTSARFQRFKRDFADLLECEFTPDKIKSGTTVPKLAEQDLFPVLKRVQKAGAAIDSSSPDDQLHQLRLDGKRLRYHLELFAPIFPGELKSVIKPAKALQEYLGDHQDACVAIKRLEEFRKSKKNLSRSERDGLKKLRKMIKRRKRHLRKSYPGNWTDFSSHTDRKQLKKLLRQSSRCSKAVQDQPGTPEKKYTIT